MRRVTTAADPRQTAGDEPPEPSVRSTLLAAMPVALAIAVAGVIFGATAGPIHGPALTIGMSLIVFSGTVQFAVVGLLAGGAGAAAVLATVLALNARNLVMGAVLRPRLPDSRLRRAVLAWFLIDESFGLAVASKRGAATVLLVSGAAAFVAWQAGTTLGVLGAEAVALEGIATAMFPVLFIGLAALTAVGRAGFVRAAFAGALVAALATVVPALHPYAPILAGLVTALVIGGQRT